MEKFAIRVITYNLLSNTFSTQQQFPFSQPYYLDFETRLFKTLKLIDSWMKVNFLICLQELSSDWLNFLEPYFKKNNYMFYYNCYNLNTLGVGIAYPINHYDLIEHDVYKCSKYIENLVSDNEYISKQLFKATQKDNTMLSLYLCPKYYGKDTGKKIMISNYHMPCKFMYEYFMVSHILAVKDRIKYLQDLWKVEKVILVGDFNTIPIKRTYNLIKGNIYDDTFLQKNNIKDLTLLESAHFKLHNKEPNYTNVNLKDKFINCIDYIFISDNIDVMSCITGLTVSNPNITSYPNGLCPSDHVPLSASLLI